MATPDVAIASYGLLEAFSCYILAASPPLEQLVAPAVCGLDELMLPAASSLHDHPSFTLTVPVANRSVEKTDTAKPTTLPGRLAPIPEADTFAPRDTSDASGMVHKVTLSDSDAAASSDGSSSDPTGHEITWLELAWYPIGTRLASTLAESPPRAPGLDIRALLAAS